MEKKLETTAMLAKFVVDTGYKDIPRATVEFSKQLILHCIGGCLGGAKIPSSKVIIDFVKAIGGTPEAAVMGAGFKSSAVNASFVGGFTPHAIEVEDGSWPGAASPITVVPVCFALAEKLNMTGKDIIESFVIGFDVQGKMAAACPGGHTRGVSLLASMGAFGAAAAAADPLARGDRTAVRRGRRFALSQRCGSRWHSRHGRADWLRWRTSDPACRKRDLGRFSQGNGPNHRAGIRDGPHPRQ